MTVVVALLRSERSWLGERALARPARLRPGREHRTVARSASSVVVSRVPGFRVAQSGVVVTTVRLHSGRAARREFRRRRRWRRSAGATPGIG